MLEEIGILFQLLVNASPRVLIIIFCFYYLQKTKSTGGYLMIAGNLILFFGIVSSTVYYNYFFDFENPYKATIVNIISRIVRVSGLGLFAIGIAMTVNNYLSLLKNSDLKN